MRKGPRRPGELQVFGAKEVAEGLGIAQPNIRTVAGLPEPYDVIASTTLWRAEEVREFAKARAKRRAKVKAA